MVKRFQIILHTSDACTARRSTAIPAQTDDLTARPDDEVEKVARRRLDPAVHTNECKLPKNPMRRGNMKRRQRSFRGLNQMFADSEIRLARVLVRHTILHDHRKIFLLLQKRNVLGRVSSHE